MKYLAQLTNPVLPANIGNSSQNTAPATAGRWISSLVSVFIVVSAGASLVYLCLGGLGWVLSQGEKGKLEESRNRITHAVLGLVIVASAWAVWVLVGNFLGLTVTSLPFPTIGQ